ncbi:MAG: hypothetical protein V1757_04280 [Actinomycetota bacterium]
MNESESRRLVEDGVISFEQAEGISGERHRLPDWTGPRTIEWLGYVGAIALFITTVVMVIDLLTPGEDLALLGFFGDLDNIPGGLAALLGAVVLLGVGWRLSKGQGATRRASGFVLLLGYLLGTLAIELLLQDLDLKDFTPIVVVIPVIVLAVFVWRRCPSLPTQLALFSMVVQTVSAFLVLFQITDRVDFQSVVLGAMLGGSVDVATRWVAALVALAVGLLWIAMGSAGTVRPRNTAFVLGGVYAWLQAFRLFGTADGWIAVSVLLTALFLWLAVSRRSSVLGGIGAVSAVVLIRQVMSLFIDAPTLRGLALEFGIPGAIALLGALMLAMRSGGASTAAASPAAPAPTPAKASEGA